ncbi:S9 family peptidase [Salisaeta longa]|uniref:S9 family peptidase n=1 Tax=Salisaeta longa TaxID=503170 RepID=UPI00040D231A|nr:S9 family peptidase [Salisaeta longa]
MRTLLTLLLACCTLAPATGQPAAQWTPALSMRYQSIAGTDVSPQGKHVAYVVRSAIMDDNTSTFRSQIHVAAADGSSAVQYTYGTASAYAPAFSPDGSHLAFLSAHEDKPQVWVMRVQGGASYRVTDRPTGVQAFQWSPSGDRIAYTAQDEKSEAEKARESAKRDVTVVGEEFRYTHLYTTTVAPHDDSTRAVQRLTGGTFSVNSFDWMPDGAALVFAHQADPRINTGFVEQDISQVPADSGAVTPLVTRPGVDTDPHVAPNGQALAFVSNGGQPEPVGLQDVYVLPLAGSGEPRKLADTPDRNANLIAWDGTDAVFIQEAVELNVHVLRLPTNGAAPTPVTTANGVFGDVSFSADGTQMAFSFQDSDTPPEVYARAVGGTERRQLSRINAEVPQPPMGRTEALSWTGPGDMPIEGLLTYPVGYTPGERVPLVVQVHGGPAGVHSRSFTGGPDIYMTQVFAQHGYAVLRPNPRGSTGYGKAFRYANIKDWGYGDFDDIMAGADAVIEQGVAHPDSLALMGWSYGGYMTSFAITRTNRFKAASMGAGLPNLISMVGTTDIPQYLKAHMGGPFWEDYATYEKHSALYRIDQAETPTQIIHGMEDDRVPTSQGIEMYRALKGVGVPTELILLPRTPHGPREPKLLMGVTPRILDWFDTHLSR